MLNVRKAEKEDLTSILEIYEQARTFMRQQGNLNQWTNGYPGRELIERDIQNIQQSVDDLEGTMLNSFRDGIIDETEYKTIKESVHRLNTEKLDIDRNYEHLSANIYIQSKTELLEEFEDAYDNYVENHETLTSYVDETIGDRVATEEEITNINDILLCTTKFILKGL